MAKDLAVFDPNQMPAHIAAFLEAPEHQNVADRNTVPSLSYSGKEWAISIDGDKKTITKKDADGDDIPIRIMRAHILGFNPNRGRAYYEGAYDRDNVQAPNCWSDDGKVPHPSIEEPISKKCETCPMSAKGSKVTDNNKATVACSQHRMLAVVPGGGIDKIQPLRLKIAITSDWAKDDKENQAQDWYAFQQYLDYLRSRNIKNTAAVITKIKFDNTEYPKLLFQAGAWASPEQLTHIAELATDEDTLKLLHGTWTSAGPDGKKIDPKGKPLPEDDEDAEGPTVAPPKKTAKAPPKAAEPDDDDAEVIPPSKPSAKADAAKTVKAKAPVVADDDDDEAPVAPPKATANPKRAAAVAEAVKKPKPVVADDDDDDAPPAKAKAPVVADDDDDAPPAKSAKKPGKAAATPTVDAAVPKGVADLLGDWDDE